MDNAKLSKYATYAWCKIVDVFQTSAIDCVNDMSLKNLVKLFNLKGELLF